MTHIWCTAIFFIRNRCEILLSTLRMMILLRIVFILAFCIADFEGKVVGVIDGDTIEVMNEGKAVRIRLNGIDCPEKSQAFGTRAKQYASELLFQKQVRVEAKGQDRYGRTIADIYLPDGTWVNKKLVEVGLAWHYKQYSTNQELANAEVAARDNKIGLWSDPAPIAPWLFRKTARTN